MRILFIVMAIFWSLIDLNTVRAANHKTIGLTAGSETGTYIKIARDIANTVSSKMNIKVSPGGSVRNVDRIRNDSDYQFAIVQYDALVYKALLDRSLRKHIRVVFPLYNEEIHILVRRDAGIDNLQDLNGKRVNIGREDTGPFITGSIIKALEELSWKESYLLPQDALLALLENDIDAMIYTVGRPWGLAEKMDASHASEVKLLEFESEALEPYFPKTTIPANTYAWQPEEVSLHATKAILVTYNYRSRAAQPKRFTHYYEQIYELVTQVTKNLDTLRANGHPKWQEIDPLDSNVNWPIHPQAKKAIADIRPKKTKPAITKRDICKMFGNC